MLSTVPCETTNSHAAPQAETITLQDQRHTYVPVVFCRIVSRGKDSTPPRFIPSTPQVSTHPTLHSSILNTGDLRP